MNSPDRSKANRLVLSVTLLPTAFQPIQPASGRINCKKFVASWAEDDECNKRERRASRAPARKRIRAERWILKKRVASFRRLTWLTRGCKRIIRTFLEIHVDASFAITLFALYMGKDLTFRRKKLYRETLKQTKRLNERNIAIKMFHVFMRNFQLNLQNIRRHVSDAGIKAHVAMFNGRGKFLFGFHFPNQLGFSRTSVQQSRTMLHSGYFIHVLRASRAVLNP